MREICLSGSMSGNRKQNHVKPDCGDTAKARSHTHREATVTAPVLDSTCAVKGAGLQRVQLPPGNWFAPPVTIETAAEATKLSELSMERVARRLGERAGHNVSER